jgi:alkylation response protein AidB-like acyl-CoA dehydrogenase
VLIDMTSPRIRIRPLVMTSGEEIQNQVFFDEVRVRKTNVVGEIDDGWTVARYLLEFELGGRAKAATRARAVSAAKATMGRAARFIGRNAVQLHGGMGMTEELAVGHYFKRLTAVQYEFGSTDDHVPRSAELTRR